MTGAPENDNDNYSKTAVLCRMALMVNLSPISIFFHHNPPTFPIAE